MKRFIPVAVLLAFLGAWFAPLANAQESPLQPAVDGLAEGVGQLSPVLDQLEPVTGQLDPAIAQLLAGIDPLLTQLQGLLAQAAPACAAIGPVLEALQPLTSQLQTLLDVDVSDVPVVGVVQPILTTVNAQVAQILALCTPATTTTAPPAAGGGGAPAPAEELPVTGGPAGLVLAGFAALGSAGVIVAARRRFF